MAISIFLPSSTLPHVVATLKNVCLTIEMSIKPELNQKLVPLHARSQLGFDLDTFTPMKKEDLRVTLD